MSSSSGLHSPRRVAVPVLVRDGKPCLNGAQKHLEILTSTANPIAINRNHINSSAFPFIHANNSMNRVWWT
jgi:hypothetical protein